MDRITSLRVFRTQESNRIAALDYISLLRDSLYIIIQIKLQASKQFSLASCTLSIRACLLPSEFY